jgi:hypothetical protein
VTQKVGNLFERRAALNQALRQSVTQHLRSMKTAFNPAALSRTTNGCAYHTRRGRGIEWGPMAQEERPAERLGAAVAHIVNDRATCRRRQWQNVDPVALATDAQQSLSPIDVI